MKPVTEPPPEMPTSGVFKAGKANAQVSTSICDFMTLACTTRYADGQIPLIR